MSTISIAGRLIGENCQPLVIAEIGINHEGDIEKAFRMIDDAAEACCECVKFQSHVIEDEMIPNDVIPANATVSIWEIMKRCALSEEDESRVKGYTESKGMIFLSTPFSRAAAIRLERLGVAAYKIGSGECNNYPLIEHIARYGKPVILSTGMNNLESISIAVGILRSHQVPFALMHCTSIYPTPYEKYVLERWTSFNNPFRACQWVSLITPSAIIPVWGLWLWGQVFLSAISHLIKNGLVLMFPFRWIRKS